MLVGFDRSAIAEPFRLGRFVETTEADHRVHRGVPAFLPATLQQLSRGSRYRIQQPIVGRYREVPLRSPLVARMPYGRSWLSRTSVHSLRGGKLMSSCGIANDRKFGAAGGK